MPGRWVVDNLGLQGIQIGFTEAITAPIPAGAITIWTVGAGPITNFTTSYEGLTNILTVNFASPIRDDRLTLVVDYSITDIAGNELDGEIVDPANALLPSGDGVRGGQAVFRINVLQGDANRDGIVDTADAMVIVASLGLCQNVAGFDPLADLNLDGCVNAQDVAMFRLGEGRSLPATDGAAPIVTIVNPNPNGGLLDELNTVRVTINETVAAERINEQTCYLVDGAGTIHVPAFASQSIFGDAADYFFVPPLPQCGTYTVNISNALADQSGELLLTPTSPPVLTGLIPPPAPVLGVPTTLTTATSVTITGNAPGATSVEVSAPTLPLTDPMRLFTVPVTNNAFTADVPLTPDSSNPIYFTALSTCNGVRSAPMMTAVTHDTFPPEIFIDFPADGAQITTATTDVAGRVGDMLSGFMGLTVTVNGNPAIVDVGVGNNGTFFLQGVTLGAVNQPTVITAVATDSLNNTVNKQITVTRVGISASTSQMTVFSGNSQSGQVLTPLPKPIVVQMFDTDGTTKFANKLVTFKVVRSDGRLGATASEITPITDPMDPNYNPDPGVMVYQVRTDANGEALAYWRMGHDAGCGNNRVEATSTSVEGTVAFCASAAAASPSQLNIGSGNNQPAEAGGPAPEPLRVWVSDGQNPIDMQSVLFTVMSGGGLVDGQPTATATTDLTGHAQVNFTLGPNAGNNVVDATLVSNPTLQRAQFVAFGVVRDEANPTSFASVILNNAMQPIGGATCTLTVGETVLPIEISGVDGRINFNNITVAGSAHLSVDGSTATTVSGQGILLGTYPSLAFEPVIIPNAINSLPTPIRLPPLNPTSGVVFDNTQDVTLMLPGIEGLSMVLRAGVSTTVTKPDGTVVNTSNPITLSLSEVHDDDIPMPIPDGASPPFAWTLQPGGTTFDPPLEITYPNMSGLPPGSVAYILSFNHATARFEIVATGHVTDDGSQIISDPGAGLPLAGWGSFCPPYSITGDIDYDDCGADASCCNDRCCQGSTCCGNPDPCCDSSAECCGNADRCCNDDNPCCGNPDPCCDSNDSCCGNPNRCCNPDNPCCGSDDPCCNPSDPCCGNPDPCCNPDNPCCGNSAAAFAGFAPAGVDESLAPALVAAEPCCDSTDPCCNDPDPCCPCTAGGLVCCGASCCTPSQACCDGECCAPGETCCNGTTCCTLEFCCPNGVCCSDVCEKCLDNGTLSGGTITVDRDPVCVGDTITFRISGVVDSDGLKQINCTGQMNIPAVTPTYKWTVTKPDGTTFRGSGAVATILATKRGTYEIIFTAKAERECAPPGITFPQKTAEAIEVDLDVDSDNNNGINPPNRSIAEDVVEVSAPGKILCLNDDDDDGNGVPDNMQEPPPAGDNDLVPMVVEIKPNAPIMSGWQMTYDTTVVQVYQNDRATIVPSGQVFNMALTPNPKTFWIEGIFPTFFGPMAITFAIDLDGDGIFDCSDSVFVTVIQVRIDPVTSGTNPIPFNPAIVAPMTPLLLDNGVLFWDANSFELTTLQPNIDLTTVPVTWMFNVTSGFLTPTAMIVVAPDRRSARLEIPFPSFGNLGAGRMEFRIGGEVCVDVDTLIKNVQTDLEPGDFRFQVKAHLCTDGVGASTTRTAAEVRTIMSDVTKVLSQCGIIVTLSEVAVTVAPTELVSNLLESKRTDLFGIDDHASAIDVYFVQSIEGGTVSGTTLTPLASTFWEAGIAIPDVSGLPGSPTQLAGQEAVRTVAHEISHYLLNNLNLFGSGDHRPDDENLMFDDTVNYKRDLDSTQCIEMRSGFGVD